MERIAKSTEKIIDALESRDRWIGIHSFTSYLLFCVLLGGAFYFIHQNKTEKYKESDRQHIEIQAELSGRLANAEAALNARVLGEKEAKELYDLYNSGESSEFVARYTAGEHHRNSLERAVLATYAERAQAKSAKDSFKDGQKALRAGNYQKAQILFGLAAESNPGNPQAHYNHGFALLKGGNPQAGIVAFNKALKLGIESSGVKSTYYQLGVAHEATQNITEASAAYTQFLKRHPKSKLSPLARKRLAEIAPAAPSVKRKWRKRKRKAVVNKPIPGGESLAL